MTGGEAYDAADDGPDGASFVRHGPPSPPTPLVIAVPHAGRRYPPGLIESARLPRAALETIEDRLADRLIGPALTALGAVAIVARMARAYVDLNRGPREIDPAIVRPDGRAHRWIGSEKVAGGLGVIPSRIAAGGAVWRRPLDAAEVEARLAQAHGPYHDAIAAALDAAQARHGIALLLDCHSMPPLGRAGARLVVGDRHGVSADRRFTRAAIAAAGATGLAVARNRPYAGGYTLERHGLPARGRHAVQVEIDRTLYLDSALLEPGPGLGAAQTLMTGIARALVDEATGSLSLAAE